LGTSFYNLLVPLHKTHIRTSTLFIHRAIYSKFVNIFVGVFEKVRVSVIYTNCPSERYNQIVRRTVYIVEIVLESKNGKGLLAAGFFLGLTTSPILDDPEAPVPFGCFKLLFLTPALSESLR
jgi:hypothetical protein